MDYKQNNKKGGKNEEDQEEKAKNLVGGSLVSYPLPTERLVPAR